MKAYLSKIVEHIGKHYIFKLDKMLIAGNFCGIGKIDEQFGMIFINVETVGRNLPESCALLIPPFELKCTLRSDFIDLRRECRQLFEKYSLSKALKKLFYPIHKIIDISYNEWTTTTGRYMRRTYELSPSMLRLSR
jgi:hypothetical protein